MNILYAIICLIAGFIWANRLMGATRRKRHPYWGLLISSVFTAFAWFYSPVIVGLYIAAIFITILITWGGFGIDDLPNWLTRRRS
jgi:hypothetical protein